MGRGVQEGVCSGLIAGQVSLISHERRRRRRRREETATEKKGLGALEAGAQTNKTASKKMNLENKSISRIPSVFKS